MKAPISVSLIILSTFLTIGLVYIVVENAEKINQTIPKIKEEKANEINTLNNQLALDNLAEGKKEHNKDQEINMAKDVIDDDNYDNDDDEMDSEDKELIKSIANLSDNDLTMQMKNLKDQAKKEKLVDILNQKNADENLKMQAKKMLEKIALMGLEITRRRFVEQEPELKDPLFAHKDSLREIREALDD